MGCKTGSWTSFDKWLFEEGLTAPWYNMCMGCASCDDQYADEMIDWRFEVRDYMKKRFSAWLTLKPYDCNPELEGRKNG